MRLEVRLKRSAEKELAALPDKVHDRIVAALLALKNSPFPKGCAKLQGRDGYRIRVGDYRILCTVEPGKHLVEIYSIAHRREAYRV